MEVVFYLVAANTLLIGFYGNELTVGRDVNQRVFCAGEFHYFAFFVDRAESHVHAVVVFGLVLVESLADVAVLVCEYVVRFHYALAYECGENFCAHHAHERSRNAVSCTVGGSDDYPVGSFGKPVEVAAHDVARTE